MKGSFYSPEFAIARNENGNLVLFAVGSGFALYANTLVSPGQWSGWVSLGGILNDKFTAIIDGINRIDLFASNREDNSLLQSLQQLPNGGFTAWAGLGGTFFGTPAVALNQDGRLEAFVRGTDNAVWHNWQTSPPTTNDSNPAWTGWQSLGGAITSDPIAAVNADGRIEIFATGTDSGLYHNYQTAPNSGWSGWSGLGGVITNDLVVAANADGHLEVFARVADGSLWHIYQIMTYPGWSGWESLGGWIAGKPAVAKNANGCLEVFVCAEGNTLCHIAQTQASVSGSWGAWGGLGGAICPNLAVILGTDNCLNVFARGTDGHLHCIQETGAGTDNWSTWSSIEGLYPGMAESYLTSPNYGYDFVTAVTQDSINLTMKHFLNTLDEPEFSKIDYASLIKEAAGIDPFAIPNNTPTDDPRIISLLKAGFLAAFKAQIGLPKMPPYKIPNIVTLGDDAKSFIFSLMCHEFIVVQYTPSSSTTPASWMNIQQPYDDPWLFTAKVDLKLYATAKSDYDKLPPAVQKQIANLGSTAFSVQQLLLDLDNATLETMPTIPGVNSNSALYTCLKTHFVDCYFTAMQAQGAPLLGCTITIGQPDPSSLSLTNINMAVSPLVGIFGQPLPEPTPSQKALTTLCYLCETNNDAPHPPYPFNWNWVTAETAQDYDGVISVNRNTFANYLRGQLNAYVQSNCLSPWVQVTSTAGRGGGTVTFNCTLTPNQTPVATLPPSGQTVLHYAYSASATDSDWSSLSKITLSPSYTLSVDFVGNTIVIAQHLLVYLYIRDEGESKTLPKLVDVAVTDTYTLDIDDFGQIRPSLASVTADNSAKLDDSFWGDFGFADVDAVQGSIAAAVKAVTSTTLKPLPLSIVQNFIFPGGDTFSFDKTILFSDNQDLVATITYASPSAVYRSTLPPKKPVTGAAQ